MKLCKDTHCAFCSSNSARNKAQEIASRFVLQNSALIVQDIEQAIQDAHRMSKDGESHTERFD